MDYDVDLAKYLIDNPNSLDNLNKDKVTKIIGRRLRVTTNESVK